MDIFKGFVGFLFAVLFMGLVLAAASLALLAGVVVGAVMLGRFIHRQIIEAKAMTTPRPVGPTEILVPDEVLDGE